MVFFESFIMTELSFKSRHKNGSCFAKMLPQKKTIHKLSSTVTSAEKRLNKFSLVEKNKVKAFCLIGNKRKFKVGVDFTTLQKRPGVGKIEKQRSRRQLYYAHWDETFSEGKGNFIDFMGNTCKVNKKTP